MAVVAWLAFNDPSSVPAPKCIFKALTGWDCPGCGSQRAIHALLHGRIVEAWRFNAALLLALPLCAAYAVGVPGVRRVASRPSFGVAVALLFVAWWIGRNVAGV